VVPARLAADCWMTSGIPVVVDGKVGTEKSGTAKLKALVRSPTVARRHALKFGTSAPNRASRNRFSLSLMTKTAASLTMSRRLQPHPAHQVNTLLRLPCLILHRSAILPFSVPLAWVFVYLCSSSRRSAAVVLCHRMCSTIHRYYAPFYPTGVLRQNPSEVLPPCSGSRAKAPHPIRRVPGT
jgi:hypothetical protein